MKFKRSSQNKSRDVSHDEETIRSHSGGHVHGPGCGHESVQHDGHTDYIVDGRLHHPHGSHCHDHGSREP
jgi:hypothetical protein